MLRAGHREPVAHDQRERVPVVTHAVVRFSITIPDHGTVVRDRIGYAVQTDGKWQVAARTVCDLVWPAGTWAACPARSPS